MGRPRIVQHSFGAPGSGGPIGALGRVLGSEMAESFDFLHVAQPYPAGGINLKLIAHMAKQMRSFCPEVAHIRGLGNEGFHGVVAARLAGVPKILVSVHGSVRDLEAGKNIIRRFLVGRILEPLTLHLATHIVTVCERALEKPVLQKVGTKICGVVPNGVQVIPSSSVVRMQVRQALGVGPEDVVLIMVARLVRDKGGIDLLTALKMLPQGSTKRAVHLLMAGDGPDRDLVADAARSVTNVRVHLLGRRHDIPDLHRASDIAVLPSWHENMSNALLEAMAAGLPVIATNVGGNSEVLSRGGGVLVPPHNPAALASAIDDLIPADTRRALLGHEAQSVIRTTYTTEHMTARLSDVYRSILER